jgi:hypothetical protein
MLNPKAAYNYDDKDDLHANHRLKKVKNLKKC